MEHPTNTYNKRNAQIYAQNKYMSMTFSEQMVAIFTNMLKRMNEAEEWANRKEFEKASQLVKENINKSTGLCEFLVDFHCGQNDIKFAQIWFDFLITLTSDFVKLSINHDPILKKDIERRLCWTIDMWKKCGEEVGVENSPYPTNPDSFQKIELNV